MPTLAPPDAETLAQLLADIRGCTLCAASLPNPPRPVVVAHPQARVLLVGQAPGTRVHATGIPWNDASGERLRQWLGLDRARFYGDLRLAIAPMGFCYPGRGPSGDRPPRPECARHWRARLHAALPGIRLTLLIGQYAQAYYLGARRRATLTDTVRHALEYLPEYLPLPHPSPRNTHWRQRNPWFEATLVPQMRAHVLAALG